MSQDLRQVVREWERLRIRYGATEPPPEVDRLQRAGQRRLARLKHLRLQLSDLTAEIVVLEAEQEGLDKTLGLVLDTALRDLKAKHSEAWSPFPVLGFRIWDLRPTGFYGFREHWNHHTLSAYCPTTKTSREVPHTDGSCGEPPCGFYAAKDVVALLSENPGHQIERLAVGLVGMAGKVVEHERGYRSQEATVLAIAFAKGDTFRITDDPIEIQLLFQGVGLATTTTPDPRRGRGQPSITEGGTHHKIVTYLQAQQRRRAEWISESPNES